MTGTNLQININSLSAPDGNKNSSRSSSVVGQDNVQPNFAATTITGDKVQVSGTVKNFGKHIERSETIKIREN